MQVIKFMNLCVKKGLRIALVQSALFGACAAGLSSGRMQRPGPASQTSREASAKKSLDLRVERLGKQLNLSDAQKAEVKKLLITERGAAAHLWGDLQIAPMERMARLKVLHDDAVKQFHTILTVEQGEKYDVMVKEDEARRLAAQALVAQQMSSSPKSTQAVPATSQTSHSDPAAH